MRHISQYSFKNNQKINPIYTAFIKDDAIVLGFNEGEILTLKKQGFGR